MPARRERERGYSDTWYHWKKKLFDRENFSIEDCLAFLNK